MDLHRLVSRVPLAARIFLASIGLAVTVAALSSILIYRSSLLALRLEVSDRVHSTGTNCASQIDPMLICSAPSRMDESSTAWADLRSALFVLRTRYPDIRRISLLRQARGNGRWQLVSMGSSAELKLQDVGDGAAGTWLRRASAQEADEMPFASGRETLVSGYAPVLSPLQQVKAVVRVDLPVPRLIAAERRLLSRSCAAGGIALLLSALLCGIVTRTMMRPMNAFTHAADRVRQWDLDFCLDYNGSPETSKLVDTFNRMLSGLRESRDRLMELATRDALTGLYNHMHFQERLSIEISRANRYGGKLCLLILDVDRFKAINDTKGHPVGDAILRQLTDLLRTHTREVDIVARYGGDEIAIVLPETELADGVDKAEQLRLAVQDNWFTTAGGEKTEEGEAQGHPVHVTITIGVACYPDHHGTRDGLIMAADIALCRAKHISRNSVHAYGADFDGGEMIDPHELYKVLHDPNAAAIQSLAAAVDAKDQYTSGHSERVAHYAMDIGAALGLPAEQVNALHIGGLLHDLGKIGVPDSVLNKAGSLTEEERKMITRHTQAGSSILRRAPQLDSIIPAVLYHHERWDGAGYPDGLSHVDIPLIARIMAVADAFDAMTSERPYRKAMSVDSALMEIEAGAGKQFDPDVVRAFVATILAQSENKMAA